MRALNIASHSVRSGRPPAEIVGEAQSNLVSRRAIIKGAAAGVVTLGVSPLLSACTQVRGDPVRRGSPSSAPAWPV
jgi:hypothetical protein